jgi:peptidoglycan/LPS O-acetylase OafA/YrhL
MLFVLCLSRSIFGFFLGVLLYRSHDSWKRFMPKISFALLAVILFVILSMPLPFAAGSSGRPLYDFSIVVFLLPLFLMLGVEARVGAVAAQLGTLSFPLYAIHQPILDAIRNAGGTEHLAIVAVAALILGSWAIGHWIDEPLNLMRRSRNRALRASTPRMSQRLGNT